MIALFDGALILKENPISVSGDPEPMRSSNDNAFRVRLMALSSSLSEKENLQRNHRHPRQSCQTFAAPNRLAAA